jgi:hypothetical protein
MRSLNRALMVTVLLAVAGGSGCSRPRLEACDIGTEMCQEDVYYALARMRGDGIDPFVGVPPIRTLSREAYRQQLEAQAERNRRQREQQGEPEVNPTDTVLQLLGMITVSQAPAQTAVDTQAGGVAAYYSSRDQQVTVIERPPDSDRVADTKLLLHELVHAFQDKDVGLGGDVASADEAFARTALIEGEATHYELLGLREMQEEDPEAFDWDGLYENWRDGRRRASARSGSPYFAARWFVYPLGGHMATARWVAGGNGAVRSLQARWPRSSLAYMLGPHAEVPRDLGLSCRVPDPPEGMVLRARNELGAVQLHALLLGQDVEEELAWDLALGWRGDAFMVFFDPESQAVLGSWRFRLADESVAASVAAGFAQTEALQAVRRGADVVVNVASDAAPLTGWAGITDCR